MATSLKWRHPEAWLNDGFPAQLLANCPSIQQLDYSVNEPYSHVRPTLDVTPLASLRRLRQLTLRNAEVTDLAPLTALEWLQSLDISGTKVNCLTPLAALTSLDCSWNSEVGGGFLTSMTPLTRLQRLSFSQMKANDLMPLAGKLTALTSLDCGSTWVADLTPISALMQLRSLNINGSEVHDLSPLAPLTNLRSLNMFRSE